MNGYRMQSKAPARKVVAATGGGGVGGALAELLIYIIERGGGLDLPTRVEVAVTVLVVAACVLASGYATPPAADDKVVPN